MFCFPRFPGPFFERPRATQQSLHAVMSQKGSTKGLIAASCPRLECHWFSVSTVGAPKVPCFLEFFCCIKPTKKHSFGGLGMILPASGYLEGLQGGSGDRERPRLSGSKRDFPLLLQKRLLKALPRTSKSSLQSNRLIFFPRMLQNSSMLSSIHLSRKPQTSKHETYIYKDLTIRTAAV